MIAEADNRLIAAAPADFETRRIPLSRLGLPEPGEIHVWYLDLGILARSLRSALDGHDDGTGSTTFTSGQMRFARRFFLRLLIGAYLGLPGKSVRINRSDRGKPVLDAASHAEELHFSMAKSGNRLLVGFSSARHLGVDLEPAERKAHDPLGVARRYFSGAEAEELSSMSGAELDAAFLRTWACKEAVVKASGEGIANQLCRFTVETDPEKQPKVLRFDGTDESPWFLALLRPEQAFLGAVAAPDRRLEIRAFRLLPAGPTA
jgi:4'-phosphopantetheinyl transferase